jgi:hypothetical protein
VIKINKDLDTFLNRLYEGNLQPTSSDAVNDDASPLKLTIHAKYQRQVQKLSRPLSGYYYSLHRTSSTGERESVRTTLQARFQTFEAHLRAETQALKDLQRQWEGVIAEIFQLGVACLGENDIAALLSTAEGASPPSPATETESTLFVPEQGSLVNKTAKRKRVSFAGPDMMALFPGFLLCPVPGGLNLDVPSVPELCLEEVEQLEKEIGGLGSQHVKELQRLDREHVEWWKRKQTQLAHTFLQD